MSHWVLEYLAPWRRGPKGVIVTNGEFEKSDDYDIVEMHNHGNPGTNGDEKYSWVLGLDFEQAHEAIGQTLRWIIEHVEDNGVLMLCLDYPKFKPSQILDLIRMVNPDVWIISNELRRGKMLLILRGKRPSVEDKPTFFLDNRPEIGDTISLVPLIRRLQSEWPGCSIFACRNKHNLLPPEVVDSDRIMTWVDGVFYQETQRNEFGDYYRRVDDFYFYPIHMAKLHGWITDTGPELPEVPKLEENLSTQVRERLHEYDGKRERGFIVVAPEANFHIREWPHDRWIHVIDWLLNAGQKVVLVGREKSKYDAGRYKDSFIDLRGMTDVHELATIAKDAKLLIGCDSAPIHLAMAHGTRAIVLQGPTAGAPLFRYDVVRSVYRKDDGCRNCFQTVYGDAPYSEGKQPEIYACGGIDKMTCMHGITVTQVLDVLREELGIPAVLPGLSVCIMVKNEETTIKDALETAVVAADEVILVDTGSKDKTIEVARAVSEKVKVFENTTIGFEGSKIVDFSAARNVAFDKARFKYVMWLDAGDRIESPEILRDAVLSERSDVFHMNTVFGDAVYLRERVGPRGLVKFSDRVHETMVVDGLEGHTLSVNVRHIATEKVGREGSLERNVRLLKRMIKEEPDNGRRFRWFYYLARDLKQGGNGKEALQYFLRARDGQGFFEERAHSAVEVGRIHMEEQKYLVAIKDAYRALAVCDGWRDPYYIVGDAYFWLGDYAKAIPWFIHCLNVPKPQTVLWLWEDLYSWLPQCQLSYCYERLAQRDTALHWAREELKGAPPEQRDRVVDRIKMLGG